MTKSHFDTSVRLNSTSSRHFGLVRENEELCKYECSGTTFSQFDCFGSVVSFNLVWKLLGMSILKCTD